MRPIRFAWVAAWLVSGATSTLQAQTQTQDDDCEYKRDIATNVAMGAADALKLEAGAGSLVVRGVQGLREVRVRGTACASSTRLLGEIDVSVTRESGRVFVKTEFPDNEWRSDEQGRVDLIVEVPLGVASNISDGSGSMELSGLGDLDVTDGSGEVTISNITGSIDIEDGSGSVEITDVDGDVTVEDGSGEVSIRNAGGKVTVHDGSGSIDVRGVRGDFVVASDGSGGVDWTGVSGRVTVPQKRHDR